MPFDSNAYSAEWHKRNPEKRHAYYLKTHPNGRSIEEVYAEAKSRTEKACTRCAVVKPMEAFRKDRGSRDGRESACLPCERERLVAWNDNRRRERELLNPKDALPDGHKQCTKCGLVKAIVDFTSKGQPCKQCACDYSKAAYHENPGKSYEYNRQWCKDHPERAKEFSRVAYRKRNPGCKTIEEVKAQKEAKADRSEKACKKCGVIQPIEQYGLSKKTADGRQYQCMKCIAERGRERYYKNPKILEYRKKWSKSHLEVGRQIAHKRRARKRGIPGSHTLAQWLNLCARFDNRCVRCGVSGKKMTRDHIIPISDPRSSNDIENLQPLCLGCNSSKNNRFSVDYRETPFTGIGQDVG